MLAHVVQDRRLQSTETEIQWIAARLRRSKLYRRRRSIRGRRQPIQNRSSRITQSQQLRDLVVRFPRGVIARLSNFAILQQPTRVRLAAISWLHFVQNCVPSRNDQADRRQFQTTPRLERLQENRVYMPRQMVHRHERLSERRRQSFSVRYADKQRAHKARPLR